MMRLIANILIGMFFAGLAGSLVVAVITFVEDVQLFNYKEQPTGAASDKTEGTLESAQV